MPLIYLLLLSLATSAAAAPRSISPWGFVTDGERPHEMHALPLSRLDDDSLHRFNVLKIEPHLTLNLDSTYLRGYVLTTLVADEIALTYLDFRFTTSLDLDSIWSEQGHNLSDLVVGEDSLRIGFAPVIALGETVRVGIAYHGSPAIVDDWGGFRWAQAAGWRPQIAYSMGDGLDLEPPPANFTWFPCHADPTDKVLWEAYFRVPENRVVSTGGSLVDTVNHGDGTMTWHYGLDQSVSTYLLFIAVSDYQIMVQRETGPRIENFVYPSRVTQAQTHFSNVPAVLDGFVNLFGPYPFSRFGYAMTRIGDMEHATCVSHVDQAVQSNHSYDWLLFHEMSHQWWGDWVTCGDWRDLWLNEGFATFCEALSMEILSGHEAYLDYITGDIFPAARSATDSYSIYDPDYYWGNTVYEKGAAVMHMLRYVMGDSLFFAALRDYGQTYAFSTAVTSDWQAVCEEHYGESLDWFFQPWVYGTRYPRYHITMVPASAYFIVEQVQSTETLFHMPIDILWHLETDTVITYWNDAVRSQTFQLPQQYTPYPGEADPQHKILATFTWELATSADEVRAPLPAEFAITSVFPNPFNPVATINFELPKPSPVTLRVFNLLGEEVFHRDAGVFLAGKHTLQWDGSRASSGLYLFRIETPIVSATAKALLLK